MLKHLTFAAMTASILLLAAQSPLKAKSFKHPFGELREYHKHWLAVCPDRLNPKSKSDYDRNCWASTYSGNEDGSVGGAFPGNRLSVMKDRLTGRFKITFVANVESTYSKGGKANLRFSDGTIIPLTFGTDITTNQNSINEFVIVDRDVTYKVLSKMRYASYMVVTLPTNGGSQSIQFSTQGLRSAMNFISIEGKRHMR